jgi:hypothetical protein
MSSIALSVNNDDKLSTKVLNQDDSQFSRENILNQPNVKLVDSDPSNDLDLFCYINCKRNDSEFLRQCRGLVYHKDDLILKTFPYTLEYTESENDEIIKELPDLKDCLFFESYEGCIIKVFNFNNKWYIATNRKLDAYKSSWASKESFGSLFNKALKYHFSNTPEPYTGENVIDYFLSLLDETKQYMFLLLNNSDNRIVCDAPENPTVFHVGTYENGELNMEDKISIPYPTKLEFESLNNIYDYVDSLDYKKLQGVIIFAPNNKQVKILNNDYKELYDSRGNEPSINFRYLQVRNNNSQLEMLKFLYPDKIKDFETYETMIQTTVNNIYDSYVKRFIKKEYVTLSPEEYRVMSEAHSWHQQDRKINRINLTKIAEILNNQEPTKINRIIRRIKMEKAGKPIKVHARLLNMLKPVQNVIPSEPIGIDTEQPTEDNES